MKLTQKVGNTPPVQPDSISPAQLFDALLARYKARVYERYGHEIGGGGKATEYAHRKEIDSSGADR